MKKMAGKVALVSGSGRGIGQAIALKLAEEGARVVINDLDETQVEETLSKIKGLGAQGASCVGDVTQTGFGEQFVKAAMDQFGGLDIIVNNAGYPWDSVIQKMSDEQFQAMLDVHTVAPFRILRAASGPIREMAKQEKSEGKAVYRKVVNVSSIAGLYGNAGQMAYAAGKSSMVGMTRTLAKEWGRYNVNVNCVAFGLIETRMTQALDGEAVTANIGKNEIKMGIRPEMIQAMNQMIPLGRGGTPEEAAGAVYLLCTPESNYISGQVLLASGGLIM
ncbi:MAG: 3-oxoacyl-ACP reductase [Deltaproteobacteria bacterium]|jgi:3-oxoacyl-[acyl-carrier protein] reductase|uniref:Ketoreductase domain-containing protein n=1 Tax=marine metagenome TaxID=408172 RepID=A0A381P6D8_9ZZZZ|nr:3-oxoacyl-ACP reductase [Deltaproteobacteria bacterium]MDP6308993.1 SDR family oxidoreductase [SAR324 cluster bacterium]MDP6487363.1 SDR family oxidoreductase [SAR324 cluster bacterium]MDP6655367.1 SDR family oxidoreductase [SAR324 cluster bacterium]MDP7171198.1 SDR family oxidoreductase [SAR324 cluster bacterium]|tara:strand:- start:1692 stop:2519 length:828 start_codon:yes stop_codon:yes gene_type:complete